MRSARREHSAAPAGNRGRPDQPASTAIKRYLILGFGNPLRGDDGVGSAIIDALEQRAQLPASVALIDAGLAGMKMLTMLDGYDHVILVDAADLGLEGGEWVRLNLDQLLRSTICSDAQSTLHEAGLIDALAVGCELKLLPERISIYAIQPQDGEHLIGLSAPVRQSIPAVCEAILSEIEAAG